VCSSREKPKDALRCTSSTLCIFLHVWIFLSSEKTQLCCVWSGDSTERYTNICKGCLKGPLTMQSVPLPSKDMKMEVACFSKTSVSTYKTTRCHNQEDHSVLVSIFKNAANFLPIMTVFCNRFISLNLYHYSLKLFIVSGSCFYCTG
jgi:hypothetical protein